MTPEFAQISCEDLFARLAGGHAARVTVLTPNRRLAQALLRDFDDARAAAGLTVWETADILPVSAFVERLWDDALHASRGATPPMLLAPAEELALWEALIAASRHAQDLLSPDSTAAQCREAWQLLHAWRLAGRLQGDDGNEDVAAFLDWSARYERATRIKGQIDAARLPDALVPFLAGDAPRRPATLVLYGFDLLTPQMRAFLDALAAAGTALLASRAPPAEAAAVRVELPSARDEVVAAARWARERLERNLAAPAGAAPSRMPRIGVVVPDLAQSRAAVQRIFAATLHPGHLAPGAEDAVLPFELSLGLPLSGHALVHDALLVLRLAGRDIAFEDASRILRSPFLAGGDSEMAARARLDAALRERSGVALTLDRLLSLAAAADMPQAPVLRARLAQLAEFRKSDLFAVRTPPEWAKALAEALRITGFPGERGLDSAEFQTLGKWHELLAAFARLERVAGKMGYQEACQRLARMAADVLFQPETPEVPIQVMGILESAGLAFDHLWVLGLTDEAWPLAARPNPFLPVRLQRAAGVPEADAASSLELDRRITAGWLAAAPEVVLSHARMKGDSELAPSPLIAAIAALDAVDPGAPGAPSWRDAIRAAQALERVVDDRGPGLPAGAHGGGTQLFRDQAACPFRAFAAHRLGSVPLAAPQPGLSAADRGTLLHTALAAAWRELGDKGRLDSIGPGDLDAILGRAADESLARLRRDRPHALESRFAALERGRLVSLVRAWLDHERCRGDFAVVATEHKIAATFGGLTVNAKLDRLDRLAAGGEAVIDYKTGSAQVSAWLGPRPDEPQLPMYALASAGDVAAVAFARVKAGENEFKGLARAEGLLPGTTLVTKNRSRFARDYADWSALLQRWRAELDALGRAYAAGDARVDPKRGARTCEHCDQFLLCRVADEGRSFDDAGEGDSDE